MKIFTGAVMRFTEKLYGGGLVVAMMMMGVLVLASCSKNNKQAEQSAPVVGVLTAQPRTVVITTELTGRLKPIRESQVRARVPGILIKRLFTEGSLVKAGQALFQIDNAPYAAAMDAAKAQLATAQANLAKASADLTRYRPLVAVNAISQQEFDAAVAQKRLATAQVQSARAALKTSHINLGYAHVTAPISGRIGKALVTEGALVGQGEPTELALIQQTDNLYVDLTQTAAQATKIRRAIIAGQMQAVNGQIDVTIRLEDGSDYPQKGHLLFTDMTVDETTGQVSMRAEIPNTDGLLLPGQFVRVLIPQAQIAGAFLIPQQAVTRSPQGDTVLVVNADGSFAPRPITINQQQGPNWIVTKGLKQGDKVIVDGVGIVQLTQAKKVRTRPWVNNLSK